MIILGELVRTCYEMFQNNEYTHQCIEIGKYIYKFLLQEYHINDRRIYKCEWNGYKCLVLNTSFKGSTQFECNPDWKDYDILVSWNYTGEKFQYRIIYYKSRYKCWKTCTRIFKWRRASRCCWWWNKGIYFSFILINRNKIL